MMDPYRNLADAVVMQAAKDYRKSVMTIKRSPTAWSAGHLKKDVERFFLSAWFQELTDLDGAYILEQLRKEAGNDC